MAVQYQFWHAFLEHVRETRAAILIPNAAVALLEKEDQIVTVANGMRLANKMKKIFCVFR